MVEQLPDILSYFSHDSNANHLLIVIGGTTDGPVGAAPDAPLINAPSQTPTNLEADGPIAPVVSQTRGSTASPALNLAAPAS